MAAKAAATADFFDNKPDKEDNKQNKNEQAVKEQLKDMGSRHCDVFMERAFGGDDRADNVIVTIKDHLTGLTHDSAIPCKTAKFVAHWLQEVFGLIGYPSILHLPSSTPKMGRISWHSVS